MKRMPLFFVLIAVLFTGSLFAQEAPTGVERKGFVIGLGVGVGAISIADSNAETPFDEAQGGLSLPNLKIGFMLSDRMALLATFPGMIYEVDDRDRSFEAFIPSLQYWVNDRLWVNGGIGLAMDFPALYDMKGLEGDQFNLGCAVAVSAGFELVQRKNFALDLQSKIHLGRVFLDNDIERDAASFSVGVGFNWY